MKNDVSILIRNVSKTFKIHEDEKSTLRSLFTSFFYQGRVKSFKALNDINLEIKKGEFVGIVGRNGSGKSTLLKLIAGIYNPDSGGEIKINGGLVPFLELGVGFNPDLSGRENIFLNGTILGMTRKYLEEKFDEIVNFAEIWDFIDMPVKNYSSGMMVRLAFSIAIQSDADIYILDEILGVGDENFQKKSAQVISDFKAKGKTILYVTHNMNSVLKYCDRAVLIEKSKLVAQGDPEIIVQEYQKINEANFKNLPVNFTKKRWGKRQIEITGIEMRNDKGEESTKFSEGKINLFINYKLNTKINKKIIFWVEVFRADGTNVTTVSTNLTVREVDLTKEGPLKYSISSNYLNDDVYSL